MSSFGLNIGYLIKAVKLSQAEFNMKSKVAKLDENYKVCDCPSNSMYIFVCDQKWLYYLLDLPAEKRSHRHVSTSVFGFERLIHYSNVMSHVMIHVCVACPTVLCLGYPEGQTYLHAFSFSDLSLSICRLCLHLL